MNVPPITQNYTDSCIYRDGVGADYPLPTADYRLPLTCFHLYYSDIKMYEFGVRVDVHNVMCVSLCILCIRPRPHPHPHPRPRPKLIHSLPRRYIG